MFLFRIVRSHHDMSRIITKRQKTHVDETLKVSNISFRAGGLDMNVAGSTPNSPSKVTRLSQTRQGPHNFSSLLKFQGKHKKVEDKINSQKDINISKK